MNILTSSSALGGDIASLTGLAVLAGFLVAAAAIDVHTLRIPNALTGAAALAGLACVTVAGAGGWQSLAWAVAGLLAGGLVLLPMYALGALGAGDVKLMAAIGTFLGPLDVLYAALCALACGGLLALAFAIHRGALGRLLRNCATLVRDAGATAFAGLRPRVHMDPQASVGKLPYGVAISGGTLAFICLRHLAGG